MLTEQETTIVMSEAGSAALGLKSSIRKMDCGVPS